MKTNRAPAFMYYAKDHITTLAALRMDERGAWATLVNHCWWEGPISIELATRLIGEKLLESISFLLRTKGGTITFDWMEDARAKQAHVSRIRSEVAKGHGRPRSRGARPKSNSFPIVKLTSNKIKPSRAGNANGKGNTLKGKVPARGFPFTSIAAHNAWDKFRQMRAAIGRPLTVAATDLFYDQLIAMGEPDAIRSLQTSTRKSYPDLYVPSTPRATPQAGPVDKAIVSGAEMQRREAAAKEFHRREAEKEKARIAAQVAAEPTAPVELVTARAASERVAKLRDRLSTK